MKIFLKINFKYVMYRLIKNINRWFNILSTLISHSLKVKVTVSLKVGEMFHVEQFESNFYPYIEFESKPQIWKGVF